jgi:hypothetical protein
VREGRLERLAALQRHQHQLWEALLYPDQSDSRLFACRFRPVVVRFFESELALRVKGIRGDALEGRTSCARRLPASNRNIKISASIATTFGLSRTAMLPR